MKMMLLTLLGVSFLLSANATNITIIESQTVNSWAVQDSIWHSVAIEMGYSASIVPQSTLNNISNLNSTDVLIVSSPSASFVFINHLQTIRQFVMSGRPAYIQSEYLNTFQGNITFASLMQSFGANFNWTATVSGSPTPMNIIGTLATTPNNVSTLNYFNYGCVGTGTGVDKFLEYNGNYFGFCYSGCNGLVITISDADWVWKNESPALMKNILYKCANYSPTFFTIHLGNDTTICQGQTITLNAASATSYLWSNSSTASSINISTSGTYWLKASNGQCSVRDSITIHVNQYPTPNLGNDTTICQGQTIALNGSSATSYLWSNSSTASSINSSTAGLYWVQSSNGLCSATDSITISVNQYPTPNLGNDTTICQGQTIMLNGGSAASYLWSNSSTTPSINSSNSGIYWVESSNGHCSATDSVTITVDQYPVPNLGNDTLICQGETMMLSGGLAASYLWSNSSTASSINVSASGIYWVQASNGRCTATDSITIYQYPTPDLGNDTTICQGQTITLSGGAATSYLWSNSATASSINVSSSGIYWVQTSNGQCTEIDSITILVDQYPAPNLGNDTAICQGQTIALSGGLATSYLWSNGSTSPSINASTSGIYWVEATNTCGTYFDTLHVVDRNCNCTLYIPNAFSPDNNNLNDVFLPISNCTFSKYHLRIFNGWGETIFETQSSIDSWDGTHNGAIVPIGVYGYLLLYEFVNDSSKIKYGNVTLNR